MKANITISIDADILALAKKNNVNRSQAAEDGIIAALRETAPTNKAVAKAIKAAEEARIQKQK